MNDTARFWAKVEKIPFHTCWEWIGVRPSTYGKFWLNGRLANAHRVSYEWAKGTIPEGLTIDHLCRNRSCVNPAHLEAVSMRVNVLRGVGPTARNSHRTHCPAGHEYTQENIVGDGSHGRECLACARIRNRHAHARKKART